MELGIRIRERLNFLGITQSELARRTKVPQTTINSLIKKPRRSSPHLVRIARELHTTPAYLTGESDDPTDEALDHPDYSAEEREWLDLLRSIPAKDRNAALQLVRTIAHSALTPLVQVSQQDYRAG